ncbi:alpha/beta-hydrolase [Trichoderma citrinoviride]|uniref:Alpha/beta-hydrolase n=1 Tax=Trichoderma citrinoviride TaxID=58853 RepID=A0A2T4AXR8_9HYPO|nr:alpha/beta-hydrolase [Trichoderma citrinoviride]PTB61884.1 alpha/beta-hydrolase [Trichoderma citrinoviride]
MVPTSRSIVTLALIATSSFVLAASSNCVELNIPVTAHANNTKLNTVRVDSNVDAVEFTLSRDRWDALTIDEISAGNIAVGGNFEISGHFCVPPTPRNGENILMIASHGVGFSKGVWDSAYRPDEFSFVDAALAQGYAVLAYDRLGAGQSSLPDAYDDLQVPLQGEVLRALTEMALDGTIVTASEKTGGSSSITEYTADKVVHVGHSYGSIVTNWFLARYGSLSAGAILTGFLIDNQFAGLKVEIADLSYAPEHNPALFANRTSGYLAFGSLTALQADSFKKETLDPNVLTLWNDTIQSTLGVGEVLTLGTGVGDLVEDFTGPLQIFVGENDFAYCAGQCAGTFNMTQLHGIYPNVKDLDVYLQPNTGHVVQLSLNATAGYQVLFGFLDKNGL